MKQERTRGYIVEKENFFTHASVIVFLFSVISQLLGTMNLWTDITTIIVSIALPVVSALLFCLFVLLLGRIAVWSTILPVLGGAAYFILKATDSSEILMMIVCIVLAFLASFLYTATVVNMIRTKWICVVVFAAVFAFQIVFRAYHVFSDFANPVSFSDGMILLASLGAVFAMLCLSLALKRPKAKAEEGTDAETETGTETTDDNVTPEPGEELPADHEPVLPDEETQIAIDDNVHSAEAPETAGSEEPDKSDVVPQEPAVVPDEICQEQ